MIAQHLPTPQGSCRTCRYFAYQPCYVRGVFQMSEHCAKWFRCLPDATQCDSYEREPGSDDE